MTADAPRRFRLTIPRVIGIVLLLLLLLFIAGRVHLRRGIHQQLARLEQAGQSATLVELNLRYHDLGGKINAAFDVQGVLPRLDRIGDRLRSEKNTNQALANLPFLFNAKLPPPGLPLDPEALDRMADALQRAGPFLDELHEILGRTNQAFAYPIDLNLGVNTLLPHLSSLKATSQWLGLQAVHEAANHRPENAVEAILDNYLLAGTLEREPILISQLVRLAIVRISLDSLEWVVSHSQLSAGQLKQLRNGLQRAHPDGAIRIGLDGERCIGLDVMWYHPERFLAMGSAGGNAASPSPGASLALSAYRLSGLADLDLDYYLGVMNRAVALSTNEIAVRLNQATNLVHADLQEQGKLRFFSRLLLPGLEKAFGREATLIAAMTAADTALAIERYRLDHAGRLPESLAVLVPDYLPQAPMDPRTGEPLTLTPTPNGYSIDGKEALFTVDRPGGEQASPVLQPSPVPSSRTSH